MPFLQQQLPISLGDCLSFKLQNWKIFVNFWFFPNPANILLVKIYVKPMISWKKRDPMQIGSLLCPPEGLEFLGQYQTIPVSQSPPGAISPYIWAVGGSTIFFIKFALDHPIHDKPCFSENLKNCTLGRNFCQELGLWHTLSKLSWTLK